MHPFFIAQDGDPVMSHNGATVRHTQLGTLRSFRDAFAAGYRWFQIDAIPVADDILSAHSVTGRRIGWIRHPRAWFRTVDRHRALSSVSEVIFDPDGPDGWDTDTRWNIEMKDARGLPALRRVLDRMQAAGRLDHVMVSSPWRPKVLREVAAAYPDVAIAAPVQHGGVFGLNWFPFGRPARDYDCEQIHARFVRSRRRRATDRPHRQAWTIRSRRALEKLVVVTDPVTGEPTWRAWPIVDSRRLTVRPIQDANRRAPFDALRPPRPDAVRAVALGGGGWRGAFGGIGTVAYLSSQGAWDPNVEQVVGISGGAFAVAGLARDPVPGDVDAELRTLLGSLVGAAQQISTIVGGLVITGLVGAFAYGSTMLAAAGWGTMLLAFVPLLLAMSFLVRVVIVRRWLGLARRIYRDDRMFHDSRSGRRFAIGATGLNDGRLYSFSTSAGCERTRISQTRRPAALSDDPRDAVPLARWGLAEAVVRASSLPLIGPRAAERIWLPCPEDHAEAVDHTGACEWVPDRLVDGGLAGIFGRGLLLTPAQMQAARAGRPLVGVVEPLRAPVTSLPVLLTVDTGRALVANDAESLKDRLAWWAQRASALALEGRWLQVAFNLSYLTELEIVVDDRPANGFRLRLVRLAETETDAWPFLGVQDQEQRDLLQERLYVLRDRVHTLSLLKAREDKALDAIACAAVACALDFEATPDLTGANGVLTLVEQRLQLRPGVLVDRWQALPVPMLGRP